MNEFIEKYNALEDSLSQLEAIRELLTNAMHEGVINPTTFWRARAGINKLKLDLINRKNNIDEIHYTISLENLSKIFAMAKDIEVDPANFPVSIWADKELEIIKNFLKENYQKELTEESANQLLSALEKLDNYIDE